MCTESKVRAIAVSLINVQTFGGVVEIMNRIAVEIDGYSDTVHDYFKGLWEHIDCNDKAFQPISECNKRRCEKMGARLLLIPHPCKAVDVIVRLHNMLGWVSGGNEMMVMTDRLYSIAEESHGVPSFEED